MELHLVHTSKVMGTCLAASRSFLFTYNSVGGTQSLERDKSPTSVGTAAVPSLVAFRLFRAFLELAVHIVT